MVASTIAVPAVSAVPAEASYVEVSPAATSVRLMYAATDEYVVQPNQIITVKPAFFSEGVSVAEVKPENPAHHHLWGIDFEPDTGMVKLKAPAAPEEQTGTHFVDYGKARFSVTADDGAEASFAVDFQPEDVLADEDAVVDEENPTGGSGQPGAESPEGDTPADNGDPAEGEDTPGETEEVPEADDMSEGDGDGDIADDNADDGDQEEEEEGSEVEGLSKEALSSGPSSSILARTTARVVGFVTSFLGAIIPGSSV